MLKMTAYARCVRALAGGGKRSRRAQAVVPSLIIKAVLLPAGHMAPIHLTMPEVPHIQVYMEDKLVGKKVPRMILTNLDKTFGVTMNLFAGLHNLLPDRTLEDPVSHSRDALLSLAILGHLVRAQLEGVHEFVTKNS